MELTESPVARPTRRRTRRDPTPRFLEDVTQQLDAVAGCPQLQVPAKHPARSVQRLVEQFDTSRVEGRYSSLGRHGHSPKRLLAVWVYASLQGLHRASEVARACKTDAAFRLLSGGHCISDATLKRFRAGNRALFEQAIDRTVQLAHEQELLALDELATDSMRLRAHASRSAMGTLSRSSQRLEQLEKQESSSMSEADKLKHQRSMQRHRRVLERCQAQERQSVVLSNELAALMKFPGGGSAPGHRVTVTAAGARNRLVVGVLVDADPTDRGKLPSAILQTLQVLQRAGVEETTLLRLAADAGYWDATSLKFALQMRPRIDVLVAEAKVGPKAGHEQFLGREHFALSPDERTVQCPAGRLMQGPESAGKGKRRWWGVGCSTCPMRSQCTNAPRRKFEVVLGYEAARNHMRERLTAEGAKQQYAKRPAIIEPVFSSLQSTMKFHRASSRHASTIVAEVLLKLLAHNVARLLTAHKRRLSVIWLQFHHHQWTLSQAKNVL